MINTAGLLLLLICSFSLIAQQIPLNLTIVSEQFPPYNYTEQQQAKGSNTQQVIQLLEQLSLNKEITFLPWGRAYHMALHSPNVLIFSIARNEIREDKFHWIAKLADTKACVYSLKQVSHLNNISSMQQLMSYRVATQKESLMSQILLKKGFVEHKNLVRTTSAEHAIKLLLYRRSDFTIYADQVFAYHLAKQQLVNAEQIHTNFCIDTYPLYLAASKGTPLSSIQILQQTFKQLKSANQRSLSSQQQ